MQDGIVRAHATCKSQGTRGIWAIAALCGIGIAFAPEARTAQVIGAAPQPTVVSVSDDGSGESVTDGEIVGRVSLRAPAQQRFQLRATLPVPVGTVRSTKKSVPLAVVDHDGLTVPTQVNIVTRYPASHQGASVVEVVAEVERPEGASAGDEISYYVAHHPHAPGKMQLKRSLRDMLATPGALLLKSEDVFGNVYSADLFSQVVNKDRRARTMRKGALVTEYAIHELLLPTAPQGGAEGTLNHMMGVHAYITTYDRRNYFSLDLHVHNGMDGLDKADPTDDAMQEMYFKYLKLCLPDGWNAQVCFNSPSWGGGLDKGSHTEYRIVSPRGDGKMHFIPKQGRFARRLVVFKDNARSEALAVLGHENLAFCTSGDGPAGNELWSWWNQDTARFISQAHRLPDLDHVNKGQIREQLASKYAHFRDQVSSGSTGNYPLQSGALGWAQPWGVPYGGMTGGDEIMVYDGIEQAYSGSKEGYLLRMLQARTYMDRQPTALYSKNGDPTKYEDILVTEGFGAPYVDGYFFLNPSSSSDPYGFHDAPTFHIQAVQNQGKVPPYKSNLAGWMPIDLQHYSRYTRNLKVLSWLGNDTLAKTQLVHAAEMFRMGFHHFPNTAYGNIQGSGLLARELHVANFPGQGVDYQRGEGWGVDAAVAAYAVGRPELRERYYPWFERISNLVQDGQSTCTGNVMATPVGKLMDGKAYARLTPHSSYADNSLQGIRRHVFEGRDREQFLALGYVIAGNAEALISPGFWNDSWGCPHYYVGVGLVNQQGEFCNDIPSWAKSSYGETLAYYSSFAYAYELTGNEEFLFRASQMLGGGDLLSRLLEKGTKNIKNEAALLALLQTPPSR